MAKKDLKFTAVSDIGGAETVKQERAGKKNLPSLPAHKTAPPASEAPAIVKAVVKGLQQPSQAASAAFDSYVKPDHTVAILTGRKTVAQQQADAAQREYEDYAASNPIPRLPNPAGYATSTFEAGEPDTESEQYRQAQLLRQKAQEASREAQNAADRLTYEQDMRRINALPDAVRAALHTYTEGRPNVLNPSEYSAGVRIQSRKKLKEAGLSGDEIDALSETYARYLNQVEAQKAAQLAKQHTDDGIGGTLWGNALSVGDNLVSGITGTADVLMEGAGRLLNPNDRYHNLDPNLPGFLPSVYSGTVRQETAQNIEGNASDSPLRQGAGKFGSMLYQAAMSGMDNLARAATGAGGALALAGASSFQNAVRETTLKGGTPQQAYAMGVAQAGLEILTEKVSIDKLLSTPTPENVTQLLKNAAVQGAVEMTEEEMNFAGGLIADALIMGKNSDYNRDIQELVSGGMSYEQAKKQATHNVLYQALETAAQSFLSGSMTSGTRGAFEYMVSKSQTAQDSADFTPEEQTPTAEEMAAEPLGGFTEEEIKATPDVQPVDKLESLKRDIRATFAKLNPQKQTAGTEKVNANVDANTPEGYNNAINQGGTDDGSGESNSGVQWNPQNDFEVQTAGSTENGGQNEISGAQIGVHSAAGGEVLHTSDSEGRKVKPEFRTTDDASQSIDPIRAAIRATFENLRVGQRPATDNAYQGKTGENAEYKRSKLYDNTYRNTSNQTAQNIGEDAKAADPDVDAYEATSEQETVAGAKARVQSAEDVENEYRHLTAKDGWTAEDSDTAFIVLNALRKSGQMEKFVELARKQRQQATAGGQFVQSFAKYTRTVTGATVEAVNTLNSFNPYDVPKKFYKNVGFEQWQKDTSAAVLDMANQIEAIADGDVDSMRNMIRTLAAFRRTTAWFGTTSRLTAIADKMVDNLDFDTAKEIVTAQLSQIPGDFRRRSTGEVVKSIRITNMLSSLCSVNRNLVGNASISLVDGLSDSTVGAGLDWLVSKVTGRREVGNDFVYPKEYISKAAEAAQMASLCAELDIPTDAESKYTTGKTRTFSPRSGIVGRFMSAYEKYLKYGLDVTDKFAEGGTAATVEASLQRLGKSANLTPDEIHKIAQQTAQRRTFKEERKLTKAAQSVKKGLNYIGTENIGAGDIIMPFANVGSNMAHTVIDYSSGGLTGFAEILKLIKDVKDGKPIEPGRQRKAVTDTARGITGMGLVALFTTFAAQGIIKVFDDPDKDKRGTEQAEGMSGVQLNVSAALRSMNGEGTKWKEDDITLSMDFLEPFSAHMRIGYLLAQEDSIAQMVQSYPKQAASGIALSLLDMPLMTTVSDVADIGSSFVEAAAEGDTAAVADAAGKLLGNVATGFIPAPMRQAAQMVDPYYRDTSGDTVAERAKNQLLAQIPFASMTLPKKISGLGGEQRRYAEGDELLGFFNTFFAPGKVMKISPSQISGYLNRLSEATGDKAIYPDYLAPKSITVNGENILISGKEMTETYQQTYGNNISRIYGDLMEIEGFSKLSMDIQVSAIKQAKKYATDLAKAAVSDYTASWMEDAGGNEAEMIMDKLQQKASGLSEAKYQEASAAGIPLDAMQLVSRVVANLKPEKGRTAVRDVQRYEAIVQSPEIPDDQEIDLLKLYLPDSMDKKLDKAMDMGVTPERFINAYHMYLDNDGKKAATIAQWQKNFGVDKKTAETLYKLYKGA